MNKIKTLIYCLCSHRWNSLETHNSMSKLCIFNLFKTWIERKKERQINYDCGNSQCIASLWQRKTIAWNSQRIHKYRWQMCNLRLPPVQSGKNQEKKLSWSFIQKIEYVLQTIVVALMVPIEIDGDWEKKRKLYQYVVCIICTNSARIVCALFVCFFFFISLLWISCGNVAYIRVSNAAK